jgi:hypothetical protein
MSKHIKSPALSTSFSESGKNAKKRFDNISDIKKRKTGVLAFGLILILIGIIGTLAACNNAPNNPKLSEQYEDETKQSETNSALITKTDTGRYQGLADNNFFEVNISGVPEGIEAKVFMISDKVRERFEGLKLKKEDEIKLSYYVNEKNQLIVVDISRISQSNTESENVNDLFSLTTPNGIISLMDWDDKVNIKSILGNPINENTEVLGDGADTFKGSIKKQNKYDGLELTFFSPKSNGKTFFVMGMKVTGNKYSTSRGIKIGDGLNKVMENYPTAKPIEEIGKDFKKIQYEDFNEQKNIVFSIKNGKIEWFEFMVVLQ